MATAKTMTKQIVKRRAFVPRLCPIRITPFLHRVKREWLTACLQQTPAGFPRHFLLYGRCRFMSMYFMLLRGFPALFRLFWPLKFPVAPNQHRPFCDLRQEPSNTGPPPLPGALPHTHSKTACRGFESFCPCQKPAETLRFCRFSFFMCCMIAVFTLVQIAAYRIRLYPPSPASIPSSTQNAPGFAFFGPNRVHFALFALF